ncbi:MAG: 23S rRNA (pseudouridine(1915)-N(3))-methyltransferase RlmH [Clostridium sp.]|nr:23S rRNA (pseudouridine(1915)-N(3))-methyltransferase RlmH [Prevotella sp.]MCM1429284.1 23S rRNA (pseudouridine(1915)-N(3))-methyltransferase RlmH [Clostridium sp.]MCM1475683.1 23S rRNA (pseudouridine(1915)-N(3))-methyltransferase RlmH [Muribaculaceae bacterium]
MEIELLTVGKTQNKTICGLIEDYCKRLKHYVPYRITEMPDVKNAGRLSQDERKEAEGIMILRQIAPGDVVVLLDERGDMLTSRGFSEFLQKYMASGSRRLIFVVGGPYGFSKSVYDRANRLLSLSKMTFSHEMVRLFFTEQTYRAMTILRGEPYHHD